MTSGRLFGVGVGPGDPELVTVKAQRIIGACDAVAYPEKRPGSSIARRAAAPWIAAGCDELALVYPVTTGDTDHPEGYEGALRDYYDAGAARIAAVLDTGRDVAVLCEGDPFFYGSYMYLHERLAGLYRTIVVPGVTAFSAAAAAAGTPLAKRDDVLVVAPGTLAPDVLAGHLRDADAAVVMKLGRRFGDVRAAVGLAGAAVAARGVYVERASCDGERVMALDDAGRGRAVHGARARADGADAPCPCPRPRAAPAAAAPATTTATPGSLAVVGLGPAGPDWLTPEASATLAAADELVGYGPYLDRVPRRAGQRRHASDNRVELDRAQHALALAAAGAAVAVVSSGDPGIFAMATAVLEAVESGNGRFADIELRVVPGLSAMHAAAARVGAPLGHDFAVMSLSDQRKPWAIIERRLDAAGAADFALALYNPASKTRRRAARASARGAAAPPLAGHPGRRRARRRRQRRGGLDRDPRRLRRGHRRHAHPARRRFLDDARHQRPRRPRARLHAARLPVGVIEPGERLLDVAHRLGSGPRRPRDDDHRQPALARGGELGLCHRPAGVLRDDHVELVAVDQPELAGDGERAAVQQQRMVRRQRGGVGRLDAAHEKERVAHGGERCEALAPGREEHAPAGRRQQRGGVLERRHLMPFDRAFALERRSLEAQQRGVGPRARGERRPRHALGERVRGVDHRLDALLPDIGGETFGAAEAADAHLAPRQPRLSDPSRERRDHAHARAVVERRRQRACLARSAQDEHRPHALRPAR